MNLLEKIQNAIFVKKNKVEKHDEKKEEKIQENIDVTKEIDIKTENEERIGTEKNEVKSEFVTPENYLDIIKTKLYYNRITAEDIENIEQSSISEWKKTVLLIAINNKKNNKNKCKQLIKDAKVSFERSPSKTKWLNKLQNTSLSNKPQNFDWNLYFDILEWKIDEKLKLEIEEEIKNEELAEKEKIRQEKEIREKQILEAKKLAEEESRIKNENLEKRAIEQQRMMELKLQERKKYVQNSNVKVKNNNSDKTSKVKKVKEAKMKDLYNEEINMARARACFEFSSDSSKYKDKEDCLKDVDDLGEFGSKTINMRSKMQLIMYLRKYGFSSKAMERLPKEYEIYEDLENLLLLKKAGEKIDNEGKVEKIKGKISNIEGDNEYGYILIDKILDRKEEVR